MRYPHSPEFSDTPTFYKPDTFYGVTYRTDVLSAVDWLGNRFKVGDLVMYCIGAGRGQVMALGRVLQIRAHEVVDRDYREVDGKTQYVEVGKRWDIEVQVLTEKTSGHWNSKGRSRPAWVNPMNITALLAIPGGQG